MAADMCQFTTSITGATPLPVSFLVPFKSTSAGNLISEGTRRRIEDARQRIEDTRQRMDVVRQEVRRSAPHRDMLAQPASYPTYPTAKGQRLEETRDSPATLASASASDSDPASYTFPRASPQLQALSVSTPDAASKDLSNEDDISFQFKDSSLDQQADVGGLINLHPATTVDDLLVALTEPYLLDWCLC